VNHGVVVMPVTVVAVVTGDSESGEENRCDDVQDSGDDHHPGRGLVEPAASCRNRLGRSRWCCDGGSPPGAGFWCFTHALDHARATNSRGYALIM
jgi:hypothetical protein